MANRSRAARRKEIDPTGIGELDGLDAVEVVTIHNYARAVSQYVKVAASLKAGPKKAAQIRLSNVLARALTAELEERLPGIDLFAGERLVSGALRTVNADVSEIHPTDGLRLAVEIKPVNLAVGRAIWNRFGDIRTFAVNLHLKFPFCVVGGVLAIPTFEERGTKAAKEAVAAELQEAEAPSAEIDVLAAEEAGGATAASRKSTIPLIERAVARLVRAGGRRTEGDAPHLLEAIAVIVYDPDAGAISSHHPPVATGLRWDQFIDKLVEAYQGRFEGV